MSYFGHKHQEYHWLGHLTMSLAGKKGKCRTEMQIVQGNVHIKLVNFPIILHSLSMQHTLLDVTHTTSFRPLHLGNLVTWYVSIGSRGRLNNRRCGYQYRGYQEPSYLNPDTTLTWLQLLILWQPDAPPKDLRSGGVSHTWERDGPKRE